MNLPVNLVEEILFSNSLMSFFRSHDFAPADTLMPIAAMHAQFFLQAKREGKDVTLDQYVDLYRDALALFINVMQSMEEPDAPHRT